MNFQSLSSNCDASKRLLIHERSACKALAAMNMEEWSATSAVTSRRSFLFIYFYLHTLYCVPKLNTLCRSVYRDIWDFHFLVATQETLGPASISVTCERQLIRTRSVGIMAGTTRRNLDNTWGNRKRNESSAHISPRTRNWLSAQRRRKAIKQRKESLTPGHKLPRHLKSHRSCLFFIEWHPCKGGNFLVPMNSAILPNESCSKRKRKKFLQRAFDGILDRDALETLFAFRKKRGRMLKLWPGSGRPPQTRRFSASMMLEHFLL